MNFEILPSGSYRVRKSYKGTRYSLTFDHKPTEMDVLEAIQTKLSQPAPAAPNSLDFEGCIKEYIELKKSRNSPRTTREYSRLCNSFSDEFCKKQISSITQLDVDKEIARWIDEGLAYKTMDNYIKMARAAIRKFGGPDFDLNMLPAKPKKKEVYIPTNEDIQRLHPYIRDHYPRVYIAFWISCYGLRRGEILALTMDDIDFENAVIHITKDTVQDADGNWVVKEPKTQASKRSISVSKDLTDLIRITGKIYDCVPGTLGKDLNRAQKALGIERFSLHKMRHYCCTELFDMGCSETDVMAYLGWEEESAVMRTVYKHARLKNDRDRQRDIAEKLTSRFTGFSIPRK